MKAKRKHRGIALIWVVVVAFVLIALVGVATDIGYVYYVAQQLQTAADAAALAGAQLVQTSADDAQQAAVDTALANSAAGGPVKLALNPGNAEDGDIVIGRFVSRTGIFTPTLSEPNAVKVMARRTADSLNGQVPLFFGRMLGINSTDVSRGAIAVGRGGTGAGLICLNMIEADALRVFGTGVLDVSGGSIQVNSISPDALSAGGTIVINAPEINVGGESSFKGGADYEGELYQNQPALPDPLADLPPPTWDPASNLGTVKVKNGTCALGPGYYSGGITATGGTVTLAPGIYILAGAGLDIKGNTTFIAQGVMLYITGTGSVTLEGTGQCRVTPPDSSCTYPGAGTYEGVTIFQDRNNTNASKLVGTNLLDLDGTLYFPKALTNISGTGDGFGNQLITDTLRVQGTGIITINYEGPIPAPGYKSFLVR